MKENIRLKAKVRIANPANISKYEEIELIIDTGAAFSVIKRDKLEKLGIPVSGKRKLRLANGKIIKREVGVAWFVIDGKGEGGSDVIFGNKHDAELLGLLTLEGMALSVNTKTGELEPIELLLLKLC